MRTLLIILFLCPCLTLFGQNEGKGTISGEVINTQEAGVPRAKIAIYGSDGLVAFISADEKGKFLTEQINAGIYEVHVVGRGYKRSVVAKVPVNATKNTQIAVKIFERRHTEDTIYVHSTYSIPLKEKNP